jgi:hypothetical protein
VSGILRGGRWIAIDTINTATPARKKRKPFEVSFVKLPKFWIDQLRHIPTGKSKSGEGA